MFENLGKVFSAISRPREISLSYKDLSDKNAEWTQGVYKDKHAVMSHMGYFVTGEHSQPYAFNIRDADLDGCDSEEILKSCVSSPPPFILIGDSRFTDMRMRESRMDKTHFWGTQFERCDFGRSHLDQADFRSGIEYVFMIMMNPYMHKHDFGTTRITDSSFGQASLQGARFNGTILENVDFKGASLRNACFAGARLINVDFTQADLRDADFTGVDVSSCIFNTASVERASFTRNMVKPHQLENSSGKPVMKSGLSPIQMRQLRQLRHANP